jgi:hypothetical protein
VILGAGGAFCIEFLMFSCMERGYTGAIERRLRPDVEEKCPPGRYE